MCSFFTIFSCQSTGLIFHSNSPFTTILIKIQSYKYPSYTLFSILFNLYFSILSNFQHFLIGVIMIIFFSILTIILLITNNQLVIDGARYGLLLWYQNIVPLLLPFMLISSIIESSIMEKLSSKRKTSKTPTLSILFMGIFCGYPIGAKTSAYFCKNNIISKRTGNILMPIANNVSPMFFMGYILNITLHNLIPATKAYFLLFTPYIFFLMIECLLYPNKEKLSSNRSTALHNCTSNTNTSNSNSSNTNISNVCIEQITHVGLYIMICSIIIELIMSMQSISQSAKVILSGITEITRGTTYISLCSAFDSKIKTALILSCTSFGGLSSVMQTKKVIQDSGLSLIHYIIVKILCAICTFILCILII